MQELHFTWEWLIRFVSAERTLQRTPYCSVIMKRNVKTNRQRLLKQRQCTNWSLFRYLMKNQITEKLIDYLDLAIKERTKRLRVITIQINGERINVPVSNILYMESSARIITMHLIENVRPMYQFYGNMSDLAQKFEILGFLRVHKSYLVNMKYIEIFQCKRLEIKGGILIPSSERKYSELKQRYLTWEAENKWSIF